MQFVPSQVMGYDRAITMFSPDGRLLQVEYAKKAVSLGAMALGIAFKDGIVLMADRHRIDKLLVADSVKKIAKINDKILATSAGYIPDARVIIKRCRVKAQQHRLTYGEDIDVEGLTKHVADIIQAYTQYGGIRPFGVSLLIGGADSKGPQLFLLEPTGTYFQYKAKAIGMSSTEANEFLEKEYREKMDKAEAIKLAIQTFKKALGKEYSVDRLETSVVTKDGIIEIQEAELKKL